MIYIDPSESTHHIFDSIAHKQCPHLEEWTGADFMITVSGLPVSSEALVHLHIKNGAILVQRKSGMDLIDSLGYRLNSSLERMRSAGAQQVQCVLLFIGKLVQNTECKAVVDGFVTDYTLNNVIGALEGWIERGGVYSSIEPGCLDRWIAIKEHHLEVYKDRREKYIFPDRPFQDLKTISDWRVSVATIPGIGQVKANALWNKMRDADTSNDLVTALVWLTDGLPEHKVEGIGPETIRSAREWLGIPDGWNLTLVSEKGDSDHE